MFRTTAAACAALTTAMLPVFLVGALSDHLRRDLGIDETGVGAALTALFLVAAVAAPIAGRVAERFGAAVALRTGVVLAGGLAAGIAAFASGWWQLALPLAAVGISVGLVDTGAARAFADRVPDDRLGQVFGVKEASVPAASLLAGLAVPTLAVQVGWRSTFVATLLVAAAVLVLVPRDHPSADDADDAEGVEGPLATTVGVGAVTKGRVPGAMVAFAAAVGLGAGAATAAATFLVPAMTDRGFDTAAAGLVLSAASVVSIAARILLGRVADRPATAPVTIVAVACLVGAIAAGVLATVAPAAVAVVAAVLLLGAGWGWTGLAFLSAVRAHPQAPAVASGVVLSGLGSGGALGPLAFGALAGRLSYAVAWAVVAVAFLVAAAMIGALRRRLVAAPVAA